MEQELSDELDLPMVADGKHVREKEFCMLDGRELVEVLAWNSLRTCYVRVLRTKAMIEVEPWRLKKIEKVD